MSVISKDITEERGLGEEKAQNSRMQNIAIHNLEAQYQNLLVASLETLINIVEKRYIHRWTFEKGSTDSVENI